MNEKDESSVPKATQVPQKNPVDMNQVKEEVTATLNDIQKPEDPKKEKTKEPIVKKPDDEWKPSRPSRGGGGSYSRCLMFFPTSGHMGFDIIKTSDELPPIDIVRQMVDYDIQLRLCEPIQNLIDKYHHDESIIT